MSCCGKIVDGIVGLSKAALHVNMADKLTIAARRDICRVCEFAEMRKTGEGKTGLTSFSRCEKCGCFIAPKTTLSGEKCPIGKWLTATD